MKIAVPSLYAEYGRYIDEFRAIPYYIDCLKPVERRVLLGLHDVAKNKFSKSAKIIGLIIGNYHPHGDSSTYDSLCSLVNRGFAIGQGDFGAITLKPTKPAKYRYTEAMLEPFVENFVFELVKFVSWSDPENLQEDQPNYLTSPIPIGLIGDGVITGISFNTTKIPRYRLPDLINRLINIKQREINPDIQPLTIYPNLPNFNVYEKTYGEFERILTTGKGSIILKPHMTVDNYGVHVFGKPPSGISTWLDDTAIYNIDDLSSDIFEALFSPKNGYSIDQNFINTIDKVVESNVNFVCNVIDEQNNVSTKSIDELLVKSYDIWNKHLLQKFKAEEIGWNEKLFQLEVIQIIRDIINNHNINLKRVDDIVNIFKSSYATNYSHINESDIRSACSKNNVRTLIEVQLDFISIQQKLADTQQMIQDIVNVAFNKMMGYIQ